MEVNVVDFEDILPAIADATSVDSINTFDQGFTLLRRLGGSCGEP